MSKMIGKISLLAVGVMLFSSVQVASAALSTRVTLDPFTKLAEDINAVTKVGQLQPLIVRLSKYCKELELPDMGGCPDTITSLKEAIKVIKANPAGSEEEAQALELELNAFVEAVNELDSQFAIEYGGDDRESAQEPAKVTDLLKADPERALQNPFDQLVDWVKWWDAGSFYPKTVRSNAKFGAPMVNKFIKKFCDKLEVDFTDGCKDTLGIVKGKIKKNSKKSELNTSRREIIDTYLELLGNLSTSFESRFAGDDRTGAVKPADYTGGDPFEYKLTVVEWWDIGSLFPAVVRGKYAPKMVDEIKRDCLANAVYDEEGCGDEVQVLKDKIKNYPQKPSLNQTKENIVDAFKEVLTRLSEDYASHTPEAPAEGE
ncbi:hypothetical protein HZA42_04335 [Candidatus Peregrinibacteria bacterium]|nr:hypothetical protein [Candidatus Peregrinibacteria bacterium]